MKIITKALCAAAMIFSLIPVNAEETGTGEKFQTETAEVQEQLSSDDNQLVTESEEESAEQIELTAETEESPETDESAEAADELPQNNEESELSLDESEETEQLDDADEISSFTDVAETENESENSGKEDAAAIIEESAAEAEMSETDEVLEGSETDQYDSNGASALQGEAYAVLTDDGDLIFFRSNESYTNNTIIRPKDINGQEYYGTVYSGIESLKVDRRQDTPWYSNRESIKRIYVAKNQTIQPIDLRRWFVNCTNLVSFNQDGFDTGKVENMFELFFGCSSLESLDLSKFDTSNTVDIGQIFGYCENLKTVNVSTFDTHNMVSMHGMFMCCESLESVDVSGFDTGNVVDMGLMFESCSNLKELDVTSFDTHNVTKIENMFTRCSSLKSLDLSNFVTDKVADYQMANLFAFCESLESLDISSFSTDNITSFHQMFFYCKRLKSLNLSSFNTSKVKDMYWMFYNCSSLEELDLGSFDTSNVTDMSGMFYDCHNLKELNISSFDTSNVTNMGTMFNDCSSLETLNVKSFNTSNVTSMGGMFEGCSSLETLDVSSFDTENVTNMVNMFRFCGNLKSIDLSKFNTKNVIYMDGMFSGCSSLKELYLSDFDTSSMQYCNRMFQYCMQLEKLDLSSFNTSQIHDAFESDDLFEGCYVLKQVKLGKGITTWFYDTNLPAGTWIHKQSGISKTETELSEQYPSHASEWSGVWERQPVKFKINPVSIYVGDSVELTVSNKNLNIYWEMSDYNDCAIMMSGNTVYAYNLGVIHVTATAKEGGYVDEADIRIEFRDVTDKKEFFYNYVYAMADRGIVAGWDDGTFRPYNDCNRAAVVTFLWRLMGKPEPKNSASFSDLTYNDDFDKAISWAAENEITTGWKEDNTFRPWVTCNRAAVVTFLWRAAGRPEPKETASFSDMTGNEDFDKAISWAAENGITTGWDDNTFRPWRTCNRLAIVSFLSRYEEIQKK